MPRLRPPLKRSWNAERRSEMSQHCPGLGRMCRFARLQTCPTLEFQNNSSALQERFRNAPVLEMLQELSGNRWTHGFAPRAIPSAQSRAQRRVNAQEHTPRATLRMSRSGLPSLSSTEATEMGEARHYPDREVLMHGHCASSRANLHAGTCVVIVFQLQIVEVSVPHLIG
jgi:hypothetical protein